MSSNKRKIIKDDRGEKDSLKHRRSSLKVNLSDTSNSSEFEEESRRKFHLPHMPTSVTEDIDKIQYPKDDLLRNITVRKSSRRIASRRYNTRNHSNDNIGNTNVSNEENRNENDSSVEESIKTNVASKTSIQTTERIRKLPKVTQNLSIVLIDINKKEKSQGKICEQLKNAILQKTRELFDKQNELSIKTADVLIGANNSSKSSMLNNRVPLISRDERNVLRDTPSNYLTAENHLNTIPESCTNGDESIISTPKINWRNRQSDSSVSSEKTNSLRKKLFSNEDDLASSPANQRETNHENENIYKKSEVHSNNGTSPILSGNGCSNRLFGCTQNSNSPILSCGSTTLNRTRLSHLSQNVFTNSCNIETNKKVSDPYRSAKNLSNGTRTSVSRIQTKENLFLGSPITSSSLIKKSVRHANSNVNTLDSKVNSSDCNKSNDSEDDERAYHKTITDATQIPRICASKKESRNIMENKLGNVSSKNKSNNHKEGECVSSSTRHHTVPEQSTKSQNTYEEVPMELTTVQGKIISNSKSLSNVLSVRDTVVNDERSKEDSDSTIRTSLNVNTSLDPNLEIQEPDDCLKIRNSTTTVQSSLQVNTSLNPVHDSLNQRDQNKDKNQLTRKKSEDRIQNDSLTNTDIPYSTETDRENEFVSLENISIIERLRNISLTKERMSESNSTSTDKNNPKNAIEEGSHNNQSRGGKRSSSFGGKSYIEGTPYPISRSMLLRSQYKCSITNENQNVQKTVTLANEQGSCQHESSHHLINNERHISDGEKNGEQVTLRTSRNRSLKLVDSSILNYSTSSNESRNNECRERVIIQDSMNQLSSNESETPSYPANVSRKKKVLNQKKKLLPLHDSSQPVVFSPLENKSQTPRKRKPKNIFNKVNKLPKKHVVINDDAKKKDTDKSKTNDNELLLHIYSSIDQPQKEKPKKRRKILSKKIIVKKPMNLDILDELRNCSAITQEQAENSVRLGQSSQDFESSQKNSKDVQKTKGIVIVTTGLSREDKGTVKRIVQTIGSAQIEATVTRRTTHVITTGVRTINLLRAIIRGCWLISLEWVFKSLESRRWLNPEKYELTHFSKAVLENRKDRQLFGACFVPELFATCGVIYVQNGTTPPTPILKELIKTAGGRITEDPQKAKVTIGPDGTKEIWVLDSITTGILQPLNQYQRR
ncbi:putative uncharacterized protein DDB_G0282133 [Orussus abietinus]|uniref:putative uncharacterized protein DDB_G0282133 n=1 Tax=Orussus abietinus TaxID=222816 RepID=UPI0006261F63|nr:putative uncharacterized protein DDB_G0282133 [Orussus abietinus]